MDMYLLFVLLSLLPCVRNESTTEDKYCSLSNRNISCLPCSDLCTSVSENCYHCPKLCGKTNTCGTVCGPSCQNGACEYVETETVPICSRGCVVGFTGKGCKELCPQGCLECDQFTAKCTSCTEGRMGKDCLITSPPASTATTSRATSSRDFTSSSSRKQCANHCDFCLDSDTPCHECGNSTHCQNICNCNGTVYLTNGTQVTQETTRGPTNRNTTPVTLDGMKEKPVFQSQLYTVGGFCALSSLLVCGLVFMCYKLCQRCRSKHSTTNRGCQENGMNQIESASRSIPNDNHLGPSFHLLHEDNTSSLRCPAHDKYQRLGNRTLTGVYFQSGPNTEERLCSDSDRAVEDSALGYEMIAF